MKCKFSERDISQRLDATVCRYRGHPYYVRYRDRNLLTLYTLDSGGKKEYLSIHPNDEDFDISTVPLGYMQFDPNTVVYLSRKPSRMWKQGLSPDGLQIVFHNANIVRYANVTMLCSAFQNMVLDVYPSLNEALSELRRSEKDKEIAISRDIALKININLKLIYVYYKTEEVGWIVPDTNIVMVPSSEMAWIVSKHLNGFTWEVR